LARAKSQAESLLSFANPFTGLINKGSTPESQNSATLNLDGLRQVASSYNRGAMFDKPAAAG
ncbi:hypothetical protein U0A48_23260, partial [Escherichia coli]|nr:hypothetical protein [Escherichia coli]